MEGVVVIDRSIGIKNKFPEEYSNTRVSFLRYSEYGFWFVNDEIVVFASGDVHDIYNIELLNDETVRAVFNEASWSKFVIRKQVGRS